MSEAKTEYYRDLYLDACRYAGKLRGRIEKLEQRFRVLKGYESVDHITSTKAMKELQSLLKHWEVEDS